MSNTRTDDKRSGNAMAHDWNSGARGTGERRGNTWEDMWGVVIWTEVGKLFSSAGVLNRVALFQLVAVRWRRKWEA